MDDLQEFILFVPLYYNDGRKVAEEVIIDLEDKFFALFNGFTDEGVVRGAYRMSDGKKQVDHSQQYGILVKEECVAELRQLVAELGAKLGQESMYLKRTYSTVDFIPPQPPNGGKS